MEGPIGAGRQDVRHHSVEIIQNVPRSYPQRLKSAIGQSAVADDVALRVVPHRVRLAVNLDRQTTLEAGEVDHISIPRELSAEAQPFWPFAKLLPQNDFGQG